MECGGFIFRRRQCQSKLHHNKEHFATPIISYQILWRLFGLSKFDYQDLDAQSRKDLCDSKFSNDVLGSTLSARSKSLIFSMNDGLLTKLAVGFGKFVCDGGPFEGFIPTLSSSFARLFERASLGAFKSTSTASNANALTQEAMNVVTRRIIKYITRIMRQK